MGLNPSENSKHSPTVKFYFSISISEFVGENNLKLGSIERILFNNIGKISYINIFSTKKLIEKCY